jgi:hypothetical protein
MHLAVEVRVEYVVIGLVIAVIAFVIRRVSDPDRLARKRYDRLVAFGQENQDEE